MIIHRSQKVGAIQVSPPRANDTHIMIHPYNRMLFSLEKKGNSYTCYHMDAPLRHGQTQKYAHCVIPLR